MPPQAVTDSGKFRLDLCASCKYTYGVDDEMKNMLAQCVGFAWDESMSRKNWIKHQVAPAECEQIYFNQPLIITNDIEHSENAARFSVLGQTDDDRKLFIAFAVRKDQILVISARDMSRKERKAYEQL